VGLLVLVGCLVAAWAFALFERELAVALLGADIPPMSAPDRGQLTSWSGLVGHLGRSVTWNSMAFLVLKFPLGLVFATGAALPLTAAALLLATPFTILGSGSSAFDRPVLLPLVAWLVVMGVALLTLTMHLANWVARAWAGLAEMMLGVAREERDPWAAQRRAVDTQMVRLRRKLRSFGQHIEAVWGMGYRLRPPAGGVAPSLRAGS
jgi:hypothetical protein